MVHPRVLDYLSFSGFFQKAMPSEESGKRYIFCEAANEARDYQGEIILAKALQDSAEYFLRYGNVDIDHVSMTGVANGVPNYLDFEIGHPVVVKVDGAKTFMKAELFQGKSKSAERAQSVWESLTTLNPPARWYPSVGGTVLERDPKDSSIVRKVRWTNVGLSRTPVNQTVPTISTLPMGSLAKSWGPLGLDMNKALSAAYDTEAAALPGDTPRSYFEFRDRIAGDIRQRRVSPDARSIQQQAVWHYGLLNDTAAQWTERFLTSLVDARKVDNRR